MRAWISIFFAVNCARSFSFSSISGPSPLGHPIMKRAPTEAEPTDCRRVTKDGVVPHPVGGATIG
jgi:hypothetical protein